MVVRISDKTQNYSEVTKLLVKPIRNTMIAYYDYQIEIEQIRSKALRKLDIELERS